VLAAEDPGRLRQQRLIHVGAGIFVSCVMVRSLNFARGERGNNV
jgi:hypothetical protein